MRTLGKYMLGSGATFGYVSSRLFSYFIFTVLLMISILGMSAIHIQLTFMEIN